MLNFGPVLDSDIGDQIWLWYQLKALYLFRQSSFHLHFLISDECPHMPNLPIHIILQVIVMELSNPKGKEVIVECFFGNADHIRSVFEADIEFLVESSPLFCFY